MRLRKLILLGQLVNFVKICQEGYASRTPHLALFMLLVVFAFTRDAAAQTKIIEYTQLAPSPTGVSSAVGVYGFGTVTDGQVDSVWTVLQSTNFIGGTEVFAASKYQGTDTTALRLGHMELIANFKRNENAKSPYRALQSIGPLPAGVPTAEFRFSKSGIDLTSSASTLIGTSNGNFVVDQIVLTTTDTAGYTSAGSAVFGTNASNYNNIVSSALTTPALGCSTATVLANRPLVTSGTGIYIKVTGVTSTTAHGAADVIGHYLKQ